VLLTLLTLTPAFAAPSEAPLAVSVDAAPSDWPALIEALVALSDHAARIAAINRELAERATDSDAAARLTMALAVTSQLDTHARTDPSIVRLFLRAAMADDAQLRADALSAAAANGDPPIAPSEPSLGGTITVDSGSPAAPAPQTLRDYSSRRLKRDTLSMTTGAVYGSNGSTYGSVSTTVTWGIYDGGGAPYNTANFAALVGDTETPQVLEERLRKGRARAWGLGLGGIAMTTVGSVMVSNAGYDDDAALLGGITLATVGLVGACTFYAPPLIARARNNMVAYNYTPDAADRWIQKYNSELREELGLSSEDTQEIDLQSRAPGWSVEPVVGLAYAGLNVRF